MNESKILFRAQKTLMLTQSFLVQGSGLQLHVKEEYIVLKSSPRRYFRIVISTWSVEPVILATRNTIMCFRVRRTPSVQHHLETGLFCGDRGQTVPLSFWPDKRKHSTFYNQHTQTKPQKYPCYQSLRLFSTDLLHWQITKHEIIIF